MRERDAGEHERRPEPERVGDQQDDAARDGAAARREHEDRGEHRADARGGADGERAAEQRVRPAAAGVLQQARRDRALRPRQQPDEREPDHDQHEAGDLDLRLLVDRAADRGRAGAEQHEDGGEAEDERDARDARSAG